MVRIKGKNIVQRTTKTEYGKRAIPLNSKASNLYSRGVEVKVISKLLGHASVEITYNRYIHFFGYRRYASAGGRGVKN